MTFDQPLWIKAVEIVQAQKLPIVLMLGGFHTMMSFAGSIGSLMTNSGLSTALETCNGPVSVKHMLSGKAIAMFLRANFLTESALVAMLMSTIMEAPIPRSHQFAEVSSGSTSWQQTLLECNPNLRKLTTEETNNLFLLITAVENDYETGIEMIVNSEELNLLKFFINILKSDLIGRSRTAKLWLQYLSYVQVLKDFIRAERTGNWKLHLKSVHAMLNLFAATGHVHYAKCARLYYQQMMELNTTFPWVHSKFMNEGFHTVRRCSRFWSGL